MWWSDSFKVGSYLKRPRKSTEEKKNEEKTKKTEGDDRQRHKRIDTNTLAHTQFLFFFYSNWQTSDNGHRRYEMKYFLTWFGCVNNNYLM